MRGVGGGGGGVIRMPLLCSRLSGVIKLRFSKETLGAAVWSWKELTIYICLMPKGS